MSIKQQMIHNKNVEDILSLTPLQEGMLYHYLKNPEANYYLEQLCLSISGNIDLELMEIAWNTVIEANEMLRTFFRWEKIERPIQISLKCYKVPIRLHYLSHLDETEKKIKANEIIESDKGEKIDISKEPFRVTLIVFSDHECMMIITYQHILYDGWSFRIILKEFMQAYNNLFDGVPLEIAKKTKFKEFVKWVQDLNKEEQQEYWKQYLEGFDCKTELPVLKETQHRNGVPKSWKVTLEEKLTNRINSFTKENRITLASLFYGVWCLLLQRYYNTGDVVIGTTVSGRSVDIKGIEEVVGLFINTIPLRVHKSKDSEESIIDFFKNIDDVLKERTKYENVPLVDIQSYSGIDRKEGLFDSIVVIENFPLDKQLNVQDNKLKIDSFSISESTNYDLTLIVEMTDCIKIQFVYSTSKFDDSLIERMSGHFCNILTYTLENYDNEKLSEINMLTDEEKNELLYEFNKTMTDYLKESTLHKLFEERVERIPEKIAVVLPIPTGELTLNYRELNEKANRLARTLREKGVKSDQIVGILVDRSLEMMIGIFGILKAGGAYLPITPEYPTERIQYILNDSQTNIVLTQNKYINKVFFNGEVINLEDNKGYSSNGNNLEHINSSKDLAYVIYTSGSTGQPKGVLVEHQSVVNILTNMQNDYPLLEDETYLLKTTYTFDVSVTELFGWFMGQGRIAMLPPGGEKDFNTIVETIKRYNVTHLNFVPSMLNVFLDGIEEDDLEKLHSLRYMFVAGEVFSGELARRCKIILKNVIIENIYGPTETTIYVIRYSTANVEDERIVPIGKPLNNVTAYIINQFNKLVPVGVAGELCISGDCLTRGYFNRSNLTAEKFVADPFNPGRKMYKTGDLARWLPDGNIEFLRRIDHQVKIRGFRIEPEEIESRLLHYTPIKEAVVVAREDKNGVKYLCAYIVSKKEATVGAITIQELREFLLRSLPEYMIPSYFIQLDQMPFNVNGKIDRRALPEPEGNIVVGTQYEAPRNETEDKLANIWKDILLIEKPGINDNFFVLGGHSLRATILVAKIHKELDVEVPLSEVFQRPTIKRLGEYIQNAKLTAYERIEKVTLAEYYEASSAQKRMYTLQQFDLSSTSYNMSGSLEVRGMLNLGKVEQAFDELIRRHETLRTSFETIENHVIQRVHTFTDIKTKFKVENINHTDQNIEEVITGFVTPFDLTKTPLFRVGVIKIQEDRYILLFDMHHIISDGISMGLFINEFARLYEGKELAELRIQYKDFAKWQNNLLSSDHLKKQKEYWTGRFVDPTVNDGQVPKLNIPLDYPRPLMQNYAGDSVSVTLDQNISQNLKQIANETASTMYMVLLSGVNILLSKYSGQEDIIVGSPIAGRHHADLEKIIGIFVNTLAMRNNPKGNKTYQEFLAEVKENSIKAYENQDYQFEELIEQLDLSRDLSRNPLFDVMFTMQNFDPGDIIIENLEIKPYRYEQKISKFDLTIFATESVTTDKEICLSIEYSIKLFKRATIERMITHLTNILKIISENAQIQLSDIDILTVEERNMILYEINNTFTDYPSNKTIQELFDEQVQNKPNQLAIVFADKNLTYKELDEQSNSLANMLRKMGVQESSMVGIIVEKSCEVIVGVMAILKAGGAYLPIDPEYPQERINFMLKDCSVDVLLTQRELGEDIKQNCNVIDILDETVYQTHKENLQNISTSTSLAYVIYTSGSTGKPKGVMVEHRNVIRLIKNTNYIEFEPGDKILQTGTLAFDASTFEIWGALLNGLELHLGAKDLILRTEEMNNYITGNQISILWLTAPLFNLLADEKPEMFKTLKFLLVGGDVVSPKHVNKVLKECSSLKIINGYGPTENTTFSTCFTITQGYFSKDFSSTIPIGKPVSNSTAYIVDPYSKLCPVGVYGELCVGGDGLSRGYLNNSKLTVDKFVDNPWIPGERMYKTGDLARWLPDGNIEFLGRIDQQVKIRGFRVEPGEIENCLLNYADIKEAIVIDRQDENGKYLCAYFVADKELTSNEIREHLAQNLPQYMLPSHYLQLDTMLFNKNGKIDIKELPLPNGNLVTGTEYKAPENKIEEKLVSIWREVLSVERVGIHENFFDLGGHSLKATILVSKIRKEFNIAVPLREIFKRPTIKEIATYLQKSNQIIYTAIQPLEDKDYYEASSAQKRMYMLQQLDLRSQSYNIPAILEVEGKLDFARIEDVFKTLIKRHEALRTSFETRDDQVVQRIHKAVEFKLENLESAGQSNRSINEIIRKFIRTFDLNHAPLFRAGVISLAEDQFMLLFDIHHIISDGTSMGILVNEFATLYQGKELDHLRIQYKDYAEWQNNLLRSGSIKNQEKYWMSRFKGLHDGEVPILNFPTDNPRPVMQSLEGDSISFQLDKELTKKLQKIVRKSDSTMYMVLLSGVSILLSKYSGQEDIITGSPIAGRPHADLEKMIGMFVNTIAMRNNLDGDKTFKEFLNEVRKNALDAYDNQDYPFEDLVEKLALHRDLSRNPLFDVMFALQNLDHVDLNIQDLKIKPYSFENKTSKFDLSFTASEVVIAPGEEEIHLTIEYSTKLFKKETIKRVGAHLINILKEVTLNTDIQLSEILMLSEEEKDQILYEFNNTYVDYPRDQTLHALLEEKVEVIPNNTAAVWNTLTGETKLTYRELNEKANRLARTLRQKGVKSDSIVGILVDRSIEMLIGIFGILKAGGAYLPITPDYPVNRIQYILNDSKTTIILMQSEYIDKVTFNGEILNLDDPKVYSSPGDNLEHINTAKDLAYIIYTSGSTGNPKGVIVEHQSVVNILTNMQNDYPLSEDGTYLLKTTFTFDVSVTELFGWFMGNGRIALLPPGGEKDVNAIVDAIKDYNVTHINFVPSMLNVFLDGITEQDMDKIVTLRYMFVAGEAFPKELAQRCNKVLENVIVENIYGPTETTIYVTRYSTGRLNEEDIVPIGKPLNNITAYIVNKYSKLLPIGIAGELCIAGECLSRGYFNQSDLTAEKFAPNLFGKNLEEKMYRTGDLVRWLPDGNLEYLGRIDHQVKIRGFRIETGEIESQLLHHDLIKEVLVVDYEDKNGAKYLCAYVVSDRDVTAGQLREFLLTSLPEYMIPSYFVRLDQMPLNAHGKVDRKALPTPEGKSMVETEYEAPRNRTEEKLVTIWNNLLGEALGKDSIGIHDNFFELGGHSLKATVLSGKIFKEFNVRIQLDQIFKNPTIQALAKYIDEKEKEIYSEIEPVPLREYYDLSSAQKRFWMLSQLREESTAYNMTGTKRFDASFDNSAFLKTMQSFVDRHESLRTIFITIDGEPKQKIIPHLNFEIEELDLRGYPDFERLLDEEIAKESRKPFKLDLGPLFRTKLIRSNGDDNEDRYILLFTMHHIIADGWSMEVFREEFEILYAAYKNREENSLQPLRIQYKDFATWQNELLNSEKFNFHREYWHKSLQGELQALQLPVDYPYGSIMHHQGAEYSLVIDTEVQSKLQQIANSQQASMFIILQSAYAILLSRLTREEDIIVACPVAGREHEDLKGVIGVFLNTILLRNRVAMDKSYLEFLKLVQENTLKALSYQTYPFEKLAEELKIKAEFNKPSVVSVGINMLNFEKNSKMQLTNLLDQHTQADQEMKFDLICLINEYANGIMIRCQYRTGLFKAETIEYIMDEYRRLLTEIANQPDLQIEEYTFLAKKHLQQNKTQIIVTKHYEEFKREVLDRPLIQRFEEQVERYAEKIAVKTNKNQLTYTQLNNRANQVAYQILRTFGEKGRERVALLFEHDTDMIVGMIASLKAGKVYVPLDPSDPAERLTYIVKDAGVKMIITNQQNVEYAKRLTEFINHDIRVLNIETINPETPCENPNLEVGFDQLAYIIYTSGSTGQPKGVIQACRNLLHFIRIYTNNLHISREDKLTLFSSYSFDASVMDIYGALLNGATLYPYSLKAEGNLEKLVQWLQDEEITIYHSIPTVFRYLINILTGKEDLSKIRLLVMGGEVVFKRDVDNYKKYFSEECIFINGLGPTESTVTLQYYIDKNTEISKLSVPVGYPVEETIVYVLDENDKEVSIYGVGELVYKSPYLALGYLNNPEKTNKVFLTDPVTGEGLVYKSGDLGRLLPDGSIEFVGRKDYQVKVRGYRVELNEVEIALSQLEEVKKGVVIPHVGEDGENRLIAYYETDDEVQEGSLRRKLKEKLPEYMLPAYFIQLDRIPLTANGKIDRKALPEPEGNILVGTEYEAPRNQIEEKLVSMCKDILEVNRVGINDSFFDLGGHSLKATLFISKIHKEFDIVIPFSELYKGSKIKELATYIQKSEENIYTAIRPLEEKEYYEASSAQKRMYMLQQADLSSISYNIPAVLVVEGNLNLEKLKNVFKSLITRHETLRTSFETINDQIIQRVHKTAELKFENLENIEQSNKTLEELIQKFIRPFDLSQVPLFRIGVIRLAEDQLLLMLDMHHIISDVTSMRILLNEFACLYQGKELEHLRIQYKDYAEWQNNLLRSAVMKKQEEYWLGRFTDATLSDGQVPVLNLPTDDPRPAIQSLAGDSIRFQLDRDVTKNLERVAKESGSTLYMVLLSAVNILLAKYSGQEDIIIGSPIAGRPHADLEKIIGMFVNTIAMRNNSNGNKTYEEFLNEVRKNALDAYENQEYQFEELVNKLDLRRDVSRHPLFDVMFSFHAENLQAIELDHLRFIPYDYKIKTAKFDISIDAVVTDRTIHFIIEYSTKLFRKETIERFKNHLIKLLENIIQNKTEKIDQLQILTEEEKDQLLYGTSHTTFKPFRPVILGFEEQVRRTPHNTAIIFKDQKLSYSQLDVRANQLARILIKNGVCSEKIVSLMFDKSADIIISILAVQKACGAYLPIDPNYPEDKLKFIFEDSKTEILLTHNELDKRYNIYPKNLSIINLTDKLFEDELSEKLELTISLDQLAYIIYTSGTTGNPKGVLIEQRNLAAYVMSFYNQFDISEEDVMLQQASYSFDAFVEEMYPILLKGGSLAIPENDILKDLDLLAEFIEQKRITIISCSPLLLNELNKIGHGNSIHTYISGGDVLKREYIDILLKKGRVFNTYGPTETTVCASYYECQKRGMENIPIGQPILNYKIYILDENNQIVPKGVVGEICIAGLGVGRGYLNQPQLTEEKFIQNPYNSEEIIYKSGDLGRWNADGNIEFQGRKDYQIQIRGYRVEAGEIESHLLEHKNIEKAVVVAKEFKGSKILCAYIETNGEINPVELQKELKRDLKKKLPAYMIPTHFVMVESMPTTISGKIDRKRLPEIDLNVMGDSSLPRNKMETRLVEIWRETLEITEELTGIDLDFFELGGHSLKAMRLVSKIHQEFNVRIPLNEIFQRSTIREISEYLSSRTKNEYLDIKPAKDQEYYDVTEQQKWVYMLNLLKSDDSSVSIVHAFKLNEVIQKDRVAKVVDELVKRHEGLRTSFVSNGQKVVQKIHNSVDYQIEFFQKENLNQFIAFMKKKFDLHEGPLFRIGILDTANNQTYILIVIHHIIADGWSVKILEHDFLALYRGQNLPPLKIQYKDYAQWQQSKEAQVLMLEQKDYWINEFKDGVPVLNLPTDFERPQVFSTDCGTVSFEITQEDVTRIKEIALEEKTTIFSVTLAVYYILLRNITGQNNIVIGTPTIGRRHSDLEGIVGMFTNILALRNNIDEDKTFREFIRDIQQNLLKAFEYQEYPFANLVNQLIDVKDLSRNPIFDTVFSLQEEEEVVFDLKSFEIDTQIDIDQDTQSEVDLKLRGFTNGTELTFLMIYCKKLFKEKLIKKYAGYYQQILSAVCKDKCIKLKEITLSHDFNLLTVGTDILLEDEEFDF